MAGISIPYGQGIQYLQSLQGTVGYLSISWAVSSRKSFSSSDNGTNGEYVRMLSCKCSIYVIPLNTVNTFSGEPAKRKAHEATLLCGVRSFRRIMICSGTFDKRPPSSGSMIIAGIPRFSSSAYRYSAFTFRPEAWRQST